MNGKEVYQQLPPTAGASRENAIIEAVRRGHYAPIDWVPVYSEHGSRSAVITVMADCLRLGDAEDSFRVSVTAATAQRIADMLEACLPTTRICDLVWKQAEVRAEPCLFGEPRSATSRMLDYHACVERKVAGQSGLIGDVGKHWVITNRLLTTPNRVANYGFYSAKAPYVSASGLRMWQTLGMAHNAAHVDYSQILRLVKPTVVVDGKEMSITEVGADPELAWLVTDEGIARTWRIPGVADPSSDAKPVSRAQPKAPPPPTGLSALDPNLSRGSRGSAVAVWQRFVGVKDDGVFGPITEGATKLFQVRAGLPPSGKVDANTLSAARDEPERPAPGLGDVASFVQAKHFTRANRTKPQDVHWWVVHTMEAPEKGTTAEAVAEYFRTTPRKCSAHYCFDDDSTVQCVRLEDVAWAAPGSNGHGVQAEHAGYARQNPEEWGDAFSTAMLRRSAAVAAPVFRRYQLPVRYVDRKGLKKARELMLAKKPVPDELRGVTTHNEVTWAFRLTDHTDPGKHFPMERYLRMIEAYLAP